MSVSNRPFQQETATTRILNQAKRPQSWMFFHENTASTAQLLQIFKLNYDHFAAKHKHWHLQWCSYGRSRWERPKHLRRKKKAIA